MIGTSDVVCTVADLFDVTSSAAFLVSIRMSLFTGKSRDCVSGVIAKDGAMEKVYGKLGRASILVQHHL